jgi:hypothetical protein
MAAPALTIRLTRRADDAVVFELRRSDGTTTWQKRIGQVSDFFVIHDLTHYAVETELGFREAFYGLVAAGWDLSDFGTPWPRGPLPADALPAEVIVGCFDTARASGEPLTAEACNAAMASYFANAKMPVPLLVTDDALVRVRNRLSGLTARWRTVPVRGTLELPFPDSE